MARGPRLFSQQSTTSLPICPSPEPAQKSSGAEEDLRWTQRDTVLITYADQIRSEQSSPLAALKEWLVDYGLQEALSTVHLLPFCPYSSDDGFSVIDYLQVDPDSGTWEDIASLGEEFELMYDLVLNHISSQSDWFSAYLRGESPYDQFFIESDPALDHSQVVRPRSLPLLTEVETSQGPRHVWTTFSADQIDLNYESPALVARMLRILVEYARRGARIIRLDAVAFLWKRLGTSCIHLAETHEMVRVMHDLMEHLAPRTLLLTETNVPHQENISYFGSVEDSGQGDEAHMVYQFSLPPLLLDAFLSGDASAIQQWLATLAPPPPGCTFFNFTASHDGVGVRPLEGLVSDERLAKLVQAVEARGARVNMRRKADGTDSPYELCITWRDALAPEHADPELHVRRILASQAVMLGLQGMPAVYFHTLVGTPNDNKGVEASGIYRRINRRKYDRQELDQALEDPTRQSIFQGMARMLSVRREEPAFHPHALQTVVDPQNESVLAFLRTSIDGSQRILVACNFSDQKQSIRVTPGVSMCELLSGGLVDPCESLELAPGQAVWLTPE